MTLRSDAIRGNESLSREDGSQEKLCIPFFPHERRQNERPKKSAGILEQHAPIVMLVAMVKLLSILPACTDRIFCAVDDDACLPVPQTSTTELCTGNVSE